MSRIILTVIAAILLVLPVVADDEITAGPSNRSGDIQFVFIFTLANPATYTNNALEVVKVVETPSSGLPDWSVDIITAAEKKKMDDGDSVFVLARYTKTPGMTQQQLVDAAQALYAAKLVATQTLYDNKYHQFYGARMDSTGQQGF